MITYRMEVTEKLLDAAVEIAVESAGNVRRRRRSAILLVVIGVLELAIGLLLTLRSDAQGPALLVVGVIVLAVIALLKPLQRLVIKRASGKVDELFRTGAVEYAFSDEGIALTSPAGRGQNYWDAYRSFGETEAYLYLIRGDNRSLLVDKGALREDELDELRELCARHLPPC